jgi:hypothetical protein
LFTDEGPTGEAIRRFWQISKGLTTSGVLDGDEVSEVNDDIDGDALDDLEELPENERRRSNPGMSKAQAFAKVYTDPAISTGRELERSAAVWPSLIPGSAAAELALDRPFQKLPASAGTSRRAPVL